MLIGSEQAIRIESQAANLPPERREGRILLAQRRARSELAPFVASIGVVERHGGSSPLFKTPDGSSHLVFCVLDGEWTQPHGALRAIDGALNFVGTSVRVHEKPQVSFALSLTVTFKPGSSCLFAGPPMQSLAGRNVALSELWGRDAKRLAEKLLLAASNATRLALLEDALAARLRACRPALLRAAHLTRQAISKLDRLHDENDRGLEQVAADLGTSSRHLRRIFRETLGVNPRTLLRVRRFDRTLRSARSAATRDWAALACEGGYYDQAHMIDEFRAFTSLTPTALCRKLEQL